MGELYGLKSIVNQRKVGGGKNEIKWYETCKMERQFFAKPCDSLSYLPSSLTESRSFCSRSEAFKHSTREQNSRVVIAFVGIMHLLAVLVKYHSR